jgi:hypothetical protein
MKKLTSAVFGLALTLAVAGISFAQTPAPATSAPTKDNGSAMTSAATKKHARKKATSAKKAAPATTPASTGTSKQ